MVEKKFKFPIDVDIGNANEKVCIVAIIGKHRLSNHVTKATRINAFVGIDAFEGILGEENDCEIEGFYDTERRVIYLHLKSVYDTATLLNVCQQAFSDIEKSGSEDVLQMAEHRYAKCLLFLFVVSHIILIVHPGNSFDITYVRFFRVLDSIRVKLQTSVCEHLKALRAGKEWYLAGRPCSPRVLFLFDSCTLSSAELESEEALNSKSRNQKIPPIKRLQHAIEDQIYGILRKSRVITNISNNSLFAVPANQEFVYICPKQNSRSDLVGFYLEHLRTNCSTMREGDTPKSRSYQVNRRGNQPRLSAGFSGSPGNRTATNKISPEEGLNEFLTQHIDMAFSPKGIDDNVGRNPVPAVFHLPTSEIWFKTAGQLYRMFMMEQGDGKARPHFNTLQSLLDINQRFSEGRCSKILPMAEATYQEGLPQHYTKTYHLKKLQQARRVFLQHARGPACDKYIRQLEEACEKVWHIGRQLCEQVSITGNHCINQLHRVDGEPDSASTSHLPVMPHVSQHKTRGTCNCGRRQMDREDPFDHKTANYDFLVILGEACGCSELDRVELPAFKSGKSEEMHAHKQQSVRSQCSSDDVSDVPPIALPSVSPEHQQDEEISPVLGHHGSTTEEGHGLSLLRSSDEYLYPSRAVARRNHADSSDEGSVDDGVEVDAAVAADEDNFNPDASQHAQDDVTTAAVPASDALPVLPEGGDVAVKWINSKTAMAAHEAGSHEDGIGASDTKKRSSESGSIERHLSTTEYLATMLCSDSPQGLLPRFPSWSLVCLGKPSLYLFNQGVDQPNFSHQCNFLLPWDVSVKSEQERWPAVHEAAKKKQFRRTSISLDHTVRIYVGFEYECPRGHRFFLSGPDKIFKAPPTGIFKETAGKVLCNHMPMYYPCNCRSSKGYMGQIMRLHVLVPEGPVVALDPRIRPGPDPCPYFFPGYAGEPIVLAHEGWWVLRFPYVYVGDKGAYLMPKEASKVIQCHVQKNAVCVLNQT